MAVALVPSAQAAVVETVGPTILPNCAILVVAPGGWPPFGIRDECIPLLPPLPPPPEESSDALANETAEQDD